MTNQHKNNPWFVRKAKPMSTIVGQKPKYELCHKDVDARLAGQRLQRIFGLYKTQGGAERAAAKFNQEDVTPEEAARRGR